MVHPSHFITLSSVAKKSSVYTIILQLLCKWIWICPKNAWCLLMLPASDYKRVLPLLSVLLRDFVGLRHMTVQHDRSGLWAIITSLGMNGKETT